MTLEPAANPVHAALVAAGHADCLNQGLTPEVGTEYGLVCGCGAILGEVPADLPASPAADPSVLDPFQRAVALIDPTQILTPEHVESLLSDALRRLEHGMAYEAQVIANHIEARRQYDLAYARAYDKAEGRAVEDRKNKALLACEELFNEMVHAEMIRKTVAAFMHSTRSAQSGYQSLLRSVQNALNAGRPGP